MPQTINTNMASLIAQRNLDRSQQDANVAFERLSSGLRINSAKDDAAGLAMSTRFESQIAGLNAAQRNANDGISFAQTAEGALHQINENLQRVRELTVQAGNGTNSDEDLVSIQAEIDQRLAEVNRISEQTDFNGTKVLAENIEFSFQVGANSGEVIKVDLKKTNLEELDLDVFSVSGDSRTEDPLAVLDGALQKISSLRADLGAIQNRFESTIENLSTTSVNLSAANSRIRDADFAKETAEMSRAQVLQQAGMSILGQANAQSQNVLKLLQG